MKQPIILASNSPRRRELLHQIGIPFVSRPADVDESAKPGEKPEEYAVRVALDKARTAARKAGEGIVLAADTVVVSGGALLGKPSSPDDAARMLKLLSGREHDVITGVAVIDAGKGFERTAFERTRVKFKALSDREIAAYVATGEPLDKAGAYGIQGKGALLVEKLDGCYFNVVGLPLTLAARLLEEFGLSPW